jgi:proteasome accessory factor B
VSRKSERLVNLVIALLATKRSLTKAEIFRTIEGYEGSDESMERMFERDKDELRSLGIEIEVSGIDPLFDDEQGYRIKPENFAMDSKGYSAAEIAYMSLGAQLWKDASLDEPSQRALRKLSGFNASLDVGDLPAVAPITLSAPNFLNEIINAISEKRTVEFSYLHSDLLVSKRRVNVYSYFARQSYWYFTGLDLDKQDLRTFRCDRVVGNLETSKKTQNYQIPHDWTNHSTLEEAAPKLRATLRIRKGRGSQLRSIARSVQAGAEHDSGNIEYSSETEIVSLILWHLDDVEVVSPESLRSQIRISLQALVEVHG